MYTRILETNQSKTNHVIYYDTISALGVVCYTVEFDLICVVGMGATLEVCMCMCVYVRVCAHGR